MSPQPELIIPAATSALTAKKLRRLRRLVRLMDTAVRVPGTKITIGLDSVVGLAPVVGDVATGLVSLYLIDQARRLGVDRSRLTKMYANLAIDVLGGLFPVVGDLVDVAWKANVKNLELLEEYLKQGANPGAYRRK